MNEPEEPLLDRVAVQRLWKRIERLAHGLGLDRATARQIADQVVVDMPEGTDEERLMEGRKRIVNASV